MEVFHQIEYPPFTGGVVEGRVAEDAKGLAILLAGDGDKVGQMALRDGCHREDGRGSGVFAEDVPADLADVAGADGIFHFQDLQEDGLQAAEFTPLPECVVCFDCHKRCVPGILSGPLAETKVLWHFRVSKSLQGLQEFGNQDDFAIGDTSRIL